MDVYGGVKAVYVGKACQLRLWSSMELNFAVVEVEFCPQFVPTGTDNVDLETLLMHLSVEVDSGTHEGVGNCLVVKRKGR